MTAVEGSNSPGRRLFVTSIQACLKERVSELKDSPKDKPTRRKSEKSESIINESVEQVTNDTDEGIGKYFSKSFEFKVLSDKKPPKTTAFFVEEKWKVKELLDLKLRLNEVKGKLDNFNLSDWHFHTKCVNKAGEVQKYLRKHIEPELLTQAWCKFYEIVASTCLIPKKAVDDRRLNSIHLCEAPGAFVTSLNHFLQLKHPLIQWDWMATTLNPYHEQNTHSCMINDDRLIYNTLEKWNFGVDFTGNLFNPLNMKYIVDKAKEKFSEGVLLVTADGSFDCQLTPGEQETMVAPLLYCEVITAIQILKPGGSLLLKMFTMFECETICLMYLLYLLFGKVQVFKPVTSKEGNSEVYIVCLYFNPSYNFEKILAVLMSNYGFDITKNAAMLGQKKIPDEFINQLKECAKLFEKHQETVIKSNIKLFQNMCDNERTELKNLQDNIAQEYVRRYNLEKIKFGHVVGFQSLKDVPVLNMDARFEEGSFNDRLNKPQLDMNLKLEILKKSVSRVDTHWPFQKDTVWMKFSGIPVISDINTGSPVSIVNNSKFCSGHLLKAYNEIIKLFGNLCTKSEEKSSHPAVKICDVSNKPWSLNMWVAQRECMKLITERLMDMEENSSFILTGLPLLTQFNVGLVYIIGHAFEEVGFGNPRKSGYSLFFKGLKKDCLVQINDNCLEHIRKANSSYKESVLSFVNIQDLCVDRRFYKTVIATNHICLKNFIDERISESLTI